jgi:AraC family transcriptional regulator, regulatory protein of adaptative response / methylated-DNA-[protein]-cysteine methyltransferase
MRAQGAVEPLGPPNMTFPEVFARAFGDPDLAADDRGPTTATVTWIGTPLGLMVAAATDEGVCLLEYTDPVRLERQAALLRTRLASRIAQGDHPHLAALREQLSGYFAGARKEFTLPLVARGTPFEERVWQALLRIPHGQTRSYLDIARELGSPEGQRAVGRANGLNRIAIVIPCHRVVNHGGGLGGYGGGLWRKERLLDLERGPGQKALFTD